MVDAEKGRPSLAHTCLWFAAAAAPSVVFLGRSRSIISSRVPFWQGLSFVNTDVTCPRASCITSPVYRIRTFPTRVLALQTHPADHPIMCENAAASVQKQGRHHFCWFLSCRVVRTIKPEIYSLIHRLSWEAVRYSSEHPRTFSPKNASLD